MLGKKEGSHDQWQALAAESSEPWQCGCAEVIDTIQMLLGLEQEVSRKIV